MWAVTTSIGTRVDGIKRESDARRTVHMLGITEVIGPYSWRVVDNHGHRFIAEVVDILDESLDQLSNDPLAHAVRYTSGFITNECLLEHGD